MRLFKRLLLILILFIIYTAFCAISYTKAVCTDISDAVFRLHVIANSDSTEDQNLKYLIRDKIIEYVKIITSDASSKEEAIITIKNHLDTLQSIVEKEIYNEGYNYPVKISIGAFDFPTKQYGDITLPAGIYDALKIEIGQAKGKNWWCVMFPPLCFVDITSGILPDDSKELIKDSLNNEEYGLISETAAPFELKFKIVEVLQNLTIRGIFM